MRTFVRPFTLPRDWVNNSVKGTHQQQVSERGIDLLNRDRKVLPCRGVDREVGSACLRMTHK